jgi:hypothetical protein
MRISPTFSLLMAATGIGLSIYGALIFGGVTPDAPQYRTPNGLIFLGSGAGVLAFAWLVSFLGRFVGVPSAKIVVVLAVLAGLGSVATLSIQQITVGTNTIGVQAGYGIGAAAAILTALGVIYKAYL